MGVLIPLFTRQEVVTTKRVDVDAQDAMVRIYETAFDTSQSSSSNRGFTVSTRRVKLEYCEQRGYVQ